MIVIFLGPRETLLLAFKTDQGAIEKGSEIVMVNDSDNDICRPWRHAE